MRTRRSDPTSQEEIATGVEGGGTDDDGIPDRASARRAYFPSSMGLSVLVPDAGRALDVTVTWGDYQAPAAADGEGAEGASPQRGWQRTPHLERVAVDVSRAGKPVEVPGSGELQLVVSTRKVTTHALEVVPPGTRVVSVFLVNHRKPSADARKDESFAFQAGLKLECTAGFCPRPNLRGRDGDDWDDQVADVQYRGVFEHAVGHGVATRADVDASGACHAVETTWIPSAEVEKVVPGDVGPEVELGMDALAALDTAEALAAKLSPASATPTGPGSSASARWTTVLDTPRAGAWWWSSAAGPRAWRIGWPRGSRCWWRTRRPSRRSASPTAPWRGRRGGGTRTSTARERRRGGAPSSSRSSCSTCAG